MIYFETIKGNEAIAKYSALWDEFFSAGVFEPSLSIDWTRALLNTHVEGNPFVLIVLRNSREIFGIVPVVMVKTGKYGFSYVTAMPISEYYNTHSDLFLMQSSEELANVLIKALVSLDEKWDVFRIKRYMDTNARLECLEQYLKGSTLSYQVERESPSFFIQLGNSYDTYLKSRSKGFRYNLRRYEKTVLSMGRVSYYGAENCKKIADACDKVLYIEENSWKHKQGTAITSIEKQRRFYRDFCESSFKKGWLCLRFLSIDDEPLAYEMGVIKHNKFYSLKASYHEKYKKASPSTVLFAWLIRELIQNGIEEYDFTAEPYDYEMRWTDKLRSHKSLVIYNNSYKAKIVSLYNKAKSKATAKKDSTPLQSPRTQIV